MATDDQQVLVTGRAAAPAHFRIPGNGQLRPKAVSAHYDGSGAAGDFLAALKITSDGGELVGVYPISAPIAAGASARVSWFPWVGGSGGSAASLTWRTQHAYTVTGQVIPDITPTTITFDAGAIFDANSRPLIGTGIGPYTVTSVFDYEITIGLVVEWPSAAFARYIEIVDPSFDTSSQPIRWRTRGTTTPADDIQTVYATFDGNENAPRTIELNCWQASGAPVTISRWLVASTIPYLRPPGVNQ